MSLTFAFQFTKLPVDDLDRMAEFYTAALGLERRDRIATPDFEEILLAAPGEAQMLVLIRYASAHGTGKPGCTLGYSVNDLDAARAQLIAHGATAKGPVIDLDPIPVLVCLVDDPEGNEIELIQRKPA